MQEWPASISPKPTERGAEGLRLALSDVGAPDGVPVLAAVLELLRAAVEDHARLTLEVVAPSAWGEIEVVGGHVVQARLVLVDERRTLGGAAALSSCLALEGAHVEVVRRAASPSSALGSEPPPYVDPDTTTLPYAAIPGPPPLPRERASHPAPPLAKTDPARGPEDKLLRPLSIAVLALGGIALGLIALSAVMLGLGPHAVTPVALPLAAKAIVVPAPVSSAPIAMRVRPPAPAARAVEVVAAPEVAASAEREAEDVPDVGDVEPERPMSPRRARRASDEWVSRGEALVARGRPRAAIAAFERAVRIAPRNPHAHAALASVLLETNRVTAAREHADAAVSLRRRRAEYRLLLGDVLARQGDVAGARRQVRRAARLAPRDPDVRERLAALRPR